MYMQRREQICQLRVKEVRADRDIAFKLLELVGGTERKHIEAAE
jgi:hypothetical protein